MSSLYPPLYPWQMKQWQHLIRRNRDDTLAHALLLTGTAGIGKHDFAINFARALLCSQPGSEGVACGSCKSCQLFATENHPDFQLVTPADSGGTIKIDQIRELIGYLDLHSHFSGKRIIVLSPAENMNVAAANSLLKTLEEPQPDTLLLLISANPARLPATIRSRCQLVRFELPDNEQALGWLTAQLSSTQTEPAAAGKLLGLASGAPLQALAMGQDDTLQRQQQLLAELAEISRGQQDPVAVAADWAKDDSGQPVQWLHTWVADMIRSRSGAQEFAHNQDLAPTLQSLAERIDLQRLYAFLDKVAETFRLLGTSANKRLMLEGLLIAWANIQPRNR